MPAKPRQMRRAYADGIAWGDAKQALFERIDRELAPARERYQELVAHPARIEEVLRAGAAKARARATPFMETLRRAVGLRKLTERVARAAGTQPQGPCRAALRPVSRGRQVPLQAGRRRWRRPRRVSEPFDDPKAAGEVIRRLPREAEVAAAGDPPRRAARWRACRPTRRQTVVALLRELACR